MTTPITYHHPSKKKHTTKNHPFACGLVAVARTAPGSGNFGTMSFGSFGAAHVSERFSRRPKDGPSASAALRKGSTSSLRVEKSLAAATKGNQGKPMVNKPFI